MAFALIIKNKLVLEYGIEGIDVNQCLIFRLTNIKDNVIFIVSTVLVRVIQLMQ